MSDKTLLNEGTIRRFMKLAEIEPLTNPFVDRLNEEIYEDVENLEEQDDEMDVELDEPDMDAEPDMGDMGMDAEEDPMDDMDDMGDMDDDPADDPMEELKTGIASAVGEYLEDAIADGTLEITTGDDMEAGDELDLEAEPTDDEPDADAEVDVDVGEEPEEPEELEEKALVAEVARRVTKRILASR
tara:strand:- start:3265 stop:3822 length:558 start_codon:yes stop_codon:yes gene_type:complete